MARLHLPLATLAVAASGCFDFGALPADGGGGDVAAATVTDLAVRDAPPPDLGAPPDLVAAPDLAASGLAGQACGLDAECTSGRCVGQRCAASTFALAPPISTNLALSASFIAAGDFSADGHLDAIVSAHGGGKMRVLLGDGTGHFAVGQDFPLGGQDVRTIVAADLDGDGWKDVAVVLNDAGTVTVGLGDGNGGFTGLSPYPVGENPSSVVAGDLDGDGHLDLAASITIGQAVAVLRGHGDGTFAMAIGIPLAVKPVGIVAGDWDGDGKLDLATCAPGSDTTTLLPGKGDGTFGSAVEVTVGHSPWNLAAGDWDGDGRSDLAVGNHDANSVSIVRGGAMPAVSATIDNVASPTWVATADLDLDGNLDLIVSGFEQTSAFTVLLGNGDGTFRAPRQFATGGRGGSVVAVGDWNGDGLPDLAFSNLDTNDVSVLLNVSR